MISCLSLTPNQGPGPQPRPVPWRRIEPATFQFTGWRSIHWATPARAKLCFLTELSHKLSYTRHLDKIKDLVQLFYFQPICLYLKWISYKQKIVRPCFFIPCDNICLLIGIFWPFLFNIIIVLFKFTIFLLFSTCPTVLCSFFLINYDPTIWSSLLFYCLFFNHFIFCCHFGSSTLFHSLGSYLPSRH